MPSVSLGPLGPSVGSLVRRQAPRTIGPFTHVGLAPADRQLLPSAKQGGTLPTVVNAATHRPRSSLIRVSYFA